MVQKKGKYRVCLYCSHEVKLYNNDEQFSWDLHKQEPFHRRRRLKGKKKINSKDLSNMYIQSMKDLFQSDSNINSWAEELIRLADEQLARQERNANVEKAVARSFSAIYNGNFQLILFGSRITGLTICETGDLDIFIDTSENGDMSLVDNPELENHYLQKLENYMRTNEYNTWVNVASILSCRTPIVKCLHYDTKMQCDITVMNGFGIVNTHLMALFLNNIPKLRCLILIIREWALASGFTKERDINNYALSMLVLFYLQQGKYAPSVDELKFDYSGPTNIISGYECINYEQVKCNWKSYKDTKNMSLKDLLLGFFTYFKSYDFKKDVVCPLLGKSVKKKLFEQNGRKLPPQMYPYVEKLKHKGEDFKLKKTSMCIQDPIDLAHNLTKSASERFTHNFSDMCDSSKRALETL